MGGCGSSGTHPSSPNRYSGICKTERSVLKYRSSREASGPLGHDECRMYLVSECTAAILPHSVAKIGTPFKCFSSTASELLKPHGGQSCYTSWHPCLDPFLGMHVRCRLRLHHFLFEPISQFWLALVTQNCLAGLQG